MDSRICVSIIEFGDHIQDENELVKNKYFLKNEDY